jgi:hypothetical protein
MYGAHVPNSWSMMFKVDQQLLGKARSVLWERDGIYWIIGGSCTGKSTISCAISKATGIPIYDMDDYVFDRYIARYSDGRHPASEVWFSAPNPLAWSLSLSWPEFDAMYKAANAEYLDLLAEDLIREEFRGPQIIDGGITHPSTLVQAIKPERVLCIDMDESTRVGTWETSEERAVMKEWIFALPEPEDMWAKFLSFDKLITKTIVEESRKEKIKFFFRGNATTVEELVDRIAEHFGL